MKCATAPHPYKLAEVSGPEQPLDEVPAAGLLQGQPPSSVDGVLLGVEVHAASILDRDGAALVLGCLTGCLPDLEAI